MSTDTSTRLRRLCDVLPKGRIDERFASLSRFQRLLVLGVTSVVVLTVTPLLVGGAGTPVVAVGLAIGTMHALSALIARYDRR